MYDELVKRLRDRAGAFDYDGRPDIACDYEQAANAIEELSLTANSYKRSMRGWAEEAYRAYSKYAKSIFDSPMVLDTETGIQVTEAYELLPHGRLIDADALLKKCEFVCTDEYEDVRAVRYSVIEAAPTVIPASEEKTK